MVQEYLLKQFSSGELRDLVDEAESERSAMERWGTSDFVGNRLTVGFLLNPERTAVLEQLISDPAAVENIRGQLTRLEEEERRSEANALKEKDRRFKSLVASLAPEERKNLFDDTAGDLATQYIDSNWDWASTCGFLDKFYEDVKTEKWQAYVNGKTSEYRYAESGGGALIFRGKANRAATRRRVVIERFGRINEADYTFLLHELLEDPGRRRYLRQEVIFQE